MNQRVVEESEIWNGGNMRKFVLASLMLLGSLTVQAQELKLEVEKFKLDNGMRVLLHKDSSVPLVTVNQWYDVGSYDEDPKRTGLAHFFEHLMFKGTKNYPSGSFDKILTQVGGSNNAFTSRDYTGYYEVIPSSALEKILQLEADRMVNLSLDEEEIQKEREVVKEERRMRVENSPTGLAFETLMEMSFKGHSYDWPVIGSMEHLNASTMEDFRNFYKKYYAPNNSVLVIVGDIDVPKVKKWVHKYYASIPASKITKKESAKLTTQKSRRYQRINRFDSRILGMFFVVPGAGEKESYALDILSEALGGGESSRLYKVLVDQKSIASDVGMWNYTLRHYGSVGVSVNLLGQRSFSQAENLVYSEITKISQKGLSARELERIKDRIMLDYVSALSTGSGKGRVLASTELIRNDYKEFFKDLKTYESLTNDDIKNVARKFLKRSKASVLYLGK